MFSAAAAAAGEPCTPTTAAVRAEGESNTSGGRPKVGREDNDGGVDGSAAARTVESDMMDGFGLGGTTGPPPARFSFLVGVESMRGAGRARARKVGAAVAWVIFASLEARARRSLGEAAAEPVDEATGMGWSKKPRADCVWRISLAMAASWASSGESGTVGS